jgi:FKBP-type peptidyl-prolyl cis-trans isomerase SlyD
VVVTPEDGYGEPSGQQPQRVPRSEFPQDVNLQPGMGLRAQDGEGRPFVIYIAEVRDSQVYVTVDHPMAGKNLNFHVEIVSIRDGTVDEVAHGHAHGPDDHHHH